MDENNNIHTEKTILIVDDDTDLSMLIMDMLNDNGYPVILASSLEETYSILEEESLRTLLQGKQL